MISLVQADARAMPLADGCVQTVVTSPPYWGLRDYGVPGQLGLERTPEEYVAAIVAVFREVRRVLRDDGTVWINLGDSYNAYNGNAGPGSGFSRGAACDTERPHLATGHGLRTSGLKPKDLVGIPWRVAFALQADGWWLRSDIIWAKPNPMPESVIDRPTRSHEYLFLLAKRQTYYYDAEAIAEASTYPDDDRKSRASVEQKRMPTSSIAGIRPGSAVYATRNRRTVWTIATQPYPEAHFATFPEKLLEPCILAGSRQGDLVLDPFAGSGTVGRVCVRFSRRFIGLELKREYIALAERRSRGVQMEIVA